MPKNDIKSLRLTATLTPTQSFTFISKFISELISKLPTLNLLLIFALFFMVPDVKSQAQMDKLSQLFTEANKFYMSNNFEKAEGLLTQVVQANPKYKGAYYLRAMCYLLTGQLDLAEKDFDIAIKNNPNDFDAYNGRGLVFENIGESEKAIKDYSQAIKLNSKFAEAYLNRGAVKSKIGDFEPALSDINKAITIDGNNPASYFQRAKLQYRMKWFDKAEKDFDITISKGLKNSEVYYEKGNNHFRQKKYKEAIRSYSEALKLNPKYLDALNNRALAYDAIKDVTNATKDRETLANITGIKFQPKSEIKYKKFSTKNGAITISLPDTWTATESNNNEDLQLTVTMGKNGKPNAGIPNVMITLSKNLGKRFGVTDPQQVLGFWKGSGEKNAAGYERYDLLTSKAYQHNGKFAQLNEILVQPTANSTLLYSYELAIADNGKICYAYFQCPNRQADYVQEIFYNAAKSIVVDFNK